MFLALQKEFKHFCQKNDVSKQSAGGKKQRKTNDNTAESYSAVYLPALSEWIKKDISDTTFIEKNFLDIIPFLLSQGKFEECDRVLLRLHRIITLNTSDKTERNRRASFNKYCLFIQTKYIDKRKTCSYSGAPYDLDNIASELDNLIVF